ncbi:hypothetical protein CEXT_2641 [Caerostris extrusa]|uniref:Uncharacterized protein n=1 Tax=Caerostris extrusa TaxID=172846 RepID=A0AAV4UXQ5_CAEEX|nr:hypothetical protein CEXT_2641 [Caerostris extrusa]
MVQNPELAAEMLHYFSSVQEYGSQNDSPRIYFLTCKVFSSDTWTKFMIYNPELIAKMLHYFFCYIYKNIELKMWVSKNLFLTKQVKCFLLTHGQKLWYKNPELAAEMLHYFSSVQEYGSQK